MGRLLVTAIAGALLAAAGSAAASAAPRVLFVGNSLTAANDLPAMVADLGAGVGKPLVVEMRAPGGYALEDHWNLTDVRDRIAQGNFDWVVLQQGPSSLPDSGADLHEWALTFAAAIRAAGAHPALLTVWPEWYRRGVFDSVIGNYRRAARDSSSLLIPAGAVWKLALARQPRLPLYGPDGFHPSRLGTYAAAVTTVARLLRRSPIGLPVVSGVSRKNALAVQRAAARVLDG